MKRIIKKSLFTLVLMNLTLSSAFSYQSNNDLLRWGFEKNEKRVALESVSEKKDSIEGNFRFVKGIVGDALKLDGFTTVITHMPNEIEKLNSSFSVEAWLALAAYPWNWCPVVTQMNFHNEGFSLEIGPRGELGLKMNIANNLVVCISDEKIPLRKWVHIASVYEIGIGLKIFINGHLVGKYQTEGDPRFGNKAPFRIGMNYHATKPSNQIGDIGNKPYWFSLDGIIDELSISKSARSDRYYKEKFESFDQIASPELPKRTMPRGPKTSNKFKAYYTNLKYYEEWDNLWPVATDPDIVVTFKDSPVRLIFWRGTRYSPGWVTDKDQWMCDQSVEAWDQIEGCFEHMQDRHCRYSHVRIIEDNDARKVIHWRYAPVSAFNNLWREDEKTGWAVWIDEYYYIYPDATAIRKVEWKTGSLGYPRQFQESIPLTNPEQLQGDILEADYLAVANQQGDIQYFEYLEDLSNANQKPIPDSPNIQQHNFKSPYDPFIIFEPGNAMHYIRDRDIKSFQAPGTCNHWPVGQAYCDGRRTQAADRPSSFLGFPISYPVIHQKNDRSYLHSIYGMKNISIEGLIEIGKSWSQAANLEIVNKNHFSGGQYDLSEKAYKINNISKKRDAMLEFKLHASNDSPLINPTFIIKNWGEDETNIQLNNVTLANGKDFYSGFSSRMEGTNLIVWMEMESRKSVTVKIKPLSSKAQ